MKHLVLVLAVLISVIQRKEAIRSCGQFVQFCMKLTKKVDNTSQHRGTIADCVPRFRHILFFHM